MYVLLSPSVGMSLNAHHPSHSIVSRTSGNSNTEIEPHEVVCPSHINEEAPNANFAFPSEVTGTLYVPKVRAEGKRLTRKPAKLCSPFKVGTMTHPPQTMDAALNLHAYLCTDDSMLRRLLKMLSLFLLISSLHLLTRCLPTLQYSRHTVWQHHFDRCLYCTILFCRCLPRFNVYVRFCQMSFL